MSIFSDDILTLIKERLPVSEIIRKRVTLKQKGKDFLGLCPFHGEKTPSFTVNDIKGFYHCFGCGAHGDIFKFLTDYERMTFPEAVEQCAAQAGITLAPINPQQQKALSERDTLFKLLSTAASLFHESLKTTSGKTYYDYLISRGITNGSIERFQLGAAQKGRILQFLQANNISNEIGEKAGLLNQFNSILKEKFSERLMFPILDDKARTVGFGGRTLDSAVQPKYLNSSENLIFHKGALLYGIHLMDIKESSAILVEGYLDVISLVQEGFKNVFAPMGTAVTGEQAKKVLKHFTKIYICFDGDHAGFKAMNRAAEVFIPLIQPGIELLFTILPSGQDPHSIVTSLGAKILDQKIKTSLSLVEFLALYENSIHPGEQPSIRALRRKNILDRVQHIQDPYLKSLHKNEVYHLLRNRREINELEVKKKLPQAVSLNTIYETALIKAFIVQPSLYKEFMDRLHTYPLSSNVITILNIIESYFFSGEDLEFLQIVPYIKQNLPSLDLGYILSDSFHMHVPFLNELENEKKVREGVERILEYFDSHASLEAHIKEAQERFKHSQSPTDWERLKILMTKTQDRQKND